MTIERDGDLYSIYCDNCNTGAVSVLADTWREMIDRIKDIGWISRRDSLGDWIHVCPDCAFGGWGS